MVYDRIFPSSCIEALFFFFQKCQTKLIKAIIIGKNKLYRKCYLWGNAMIFTYILRSQKCFIGSQLCLDYVGLMYLFWAILFDFQYWSIYRIFVQGTFRKCQTLLVRFYYLSACNFRMKATHSTSILCIASAAYQATYPSIKGVIRQFKGVFQMTFASFRSFQCEYKSNLDLLDSTVI